MKTPLFLVLGALLAVANASAAHRDDRDATRWLSATLEAKRDRGAAVVLSSHRLHDLAGLCDAYLFLLPQRSVVLQAHEIASTGAVTPALLTEVFDRLRGGS
ncbi:MAG TPA: hypothetical protein VHN79_11395, partial [Lacunisphaera sp.]|nr:hypothetical protein [Lacunisphaera sp.]